MKKKLTLGEFIQGEMRRRKLSITKFAEDVGVTHPIIAKFRWHGLKEEYSHKPIGEPSLDFLAKLAKATHVDLCTLVALIHPDATKADPRAGLLAARIAQLPPDKLEVFDTFLKGLAFDHFESGDDDIFVADKGTD